RQNGLVEQASLRTSQSARAVRSHGGDRPADLLTGGRCSSRTGSTSTFREEGDQAMKVGLIGTGFGTRVHMPAMRADPNIEVVAICSAQRSRAQQAAEEWGVPGVAGDYRELIARDDVEMVDVCTPPDSHAEITVAALEAGKHVLCEKP